MRTIALVFVTLAFFAAAGTTLAQSSNSTDPLDNLFNNSTDIFNPSDSSSYFSSANVKALLTLVYSAYGVAGLAFCLAIITLVCYVRRGRVMAARQQQAENDLAFDHIRERTRTEPPAVPLVYVV